MLNRYLLFFLLIITFPAKANFDFNARCINAYNNILSLKLNAARALIAEEKKANPKNSIPILLDNYIDYFEAFTSENETVFERLKKNKELRLSRLENEDKKSPYYLYSMAQINLQCAMIRNNFKEYFNAGLEINRSYNLLSQNARKFPSFLPNQKELGVINVLLGALPDNLLKTAIGWVGIKGNTQTGIRSLETLISNLPKSPYSQYYSETLFLYAFVQTDVVKDSTVYNKIISNAESVDDGSLLKSFLCGYIAMRTAHNNDAISVLTKRPSGPAYQNFPTVDYLLGVANMRRLDKSASGYLTNYLKTYKGINYIKDAYLNLAWLSLLQGDMTGYNENIKKVKSEGNLLHDRDKQAMREADYPAPNPDLLRARLLFDGGYYDKAADVLSDKRTGSFKTAKDQLEYAYRTARIYDAQGKYDQAIEFYKSTITLGRNERYYFAANSALRIGLIYEKKKNYSLAEQFFNAAIKMKNHDYENSIEGEAKQGLKRIGG